MTALPAFYSGPLCGRMDELRGFQTKIYKLTMPTHPGKTSVTHRLEPMRT